MKILICIASMGPGGAERQVTYLAKGLVEAKHDIHVLLISEGLNYERLVSSGAHIHRINKHPKTIFFAIALFQTFLAIRPDIIYLWQHPFDILGGIMAFVLGIPSAHAERTDPTLCPRGPMTLIRNCVVPMSNAIIANSDSGFKYWKRRAPEIKTVLIKNIIPDEIFHNVRASEESLNRFVSICRLDKNKNVITFLKAIKLLRNKGTFVKVLIVGEGSESSALVNYATLTNLLEHVQFTGYRSDTWSLLKGSKGLVSISFCEGEPNVILEAQALGCNIILSDIQSNRSLQCHYPMTFVNPSSVNDVANALELSMSNNASISHLSLTPCKVRTFLSSRSYFAICNDHIMVFRSLLKN